MKNIVSFNERIFISLVEPSGSGKSLHIFDWLKIGTFQPKIVNIFNFINIINLFLDKCKRKTLQLSMELTLK